MRSEKRCESSASWTGRLRDEDFASNTPGPDRCARFVMPVSVHNGESRRGTMTNLCDSGAVLEMAEPPRTGALVEIEFGTPADDTKLRLLAEVCWRDEDAGKDGSTDVGISFQNLGADGLALLRDIVDARCA